MDRATTWSAANDGDLGMIQEALDASQIYQDNTIEVLIPPSTPPYELPPNHPFVYRRQRCLQRPCCMKSTRR